VGKARKMFNSKRRWLRVTRVMARDGDKCAICKEPLDRKIRDFNHPRYITFDHITPLSLGGTDLFGNIRLAHRRCNCERGNDPIMPEDEKEFEGEQ
jgi:5-methylcytosine-specific restriction endonuclease McrA